MTSTQSQSSVPATTPGEPPFSSALRIAPGDAPGRYRAGFDGQWAVASSRIHGGLMLAVAAKGALAGLADHTGGGLLDPLAVGAEFLRAPELGPVEIETEVLKVGRTVSVVRATMTQDGRPLLTTTVSAGRLPTDPPVWTELPELLAEPPAGLSDTARDPNAAPLARACEIVLDPETFHRPDLARPAVRGWVRPRGEPADALFALFAGDVLPPVVFNLGTRGWAPTVQLTALVRARPAPGWLRAEARSCAVAGGWFDSDATVLDARGALVCQARQLALSPLR